MPLLTRLIKDVWWSGILYIVYWNQNAQKCSKNSDFFPHVHIIMILMCNSFKSSLGVEKRCEDLKWQPRVPSPFSKNSPKIPQSIISWLDCIYIFKGKKSSRWPCGPLKVNNLGVVTPFPRMKLLWRMRSCGVKRGVNRELFSMKNV